MGVYGLYDTGMDKRRLPLVEGWKMARTAKVEALLVEYQHQETAWGPHSEPALKAWAALKEAKRAASYAETRRLIAEGKIATTGL